MKAPKSQNGFTLIEVLMAIIVLSIGFLALASMTITAIKGNAVASKQTIATTLAQEKIEEIKDRPYGEVITATEDYDSVPNFSWARREMIVIDNDPEPNMKRVDVIVSTKDSKGNDKTLVAFTVLKSL